MFSSQSELIERIAAALKAAGAKEVYLFGSAIRGTTRVDSDLDFAVKGLPAANFFRAMGDAGDIFGRSIDLVDLDEDTPLTRYLMEESELQRVA